MNFQRVVQPGAVDVGYPAGKRVKLYVTIRWDGKRLAISGVEGPDSRGNAVGGCGQIIMSLKPDEVEPTEVWTADGIAKLFEIWDRWHLNDMRAGTPAQREWLDELAKINPFPGYPQSHYDWACEQLASVNMLVDNGYKYGSAWLHEDVPDDVVEWLYALPQDDSSPWRDRNSEEEPHA